MKKLSLNKTINKNTNKPYRSAGMFYTSSAGTIMGLISLYGNQKTLFRDGSLAPVFTGRAPSHLGSSLRTALNSVFLIAFILVSTLIGSFLISSVNTVSAASSTLSLTVSSNSIEMSMLPSSPNGTFAKSADITITASTNNATGYTLSVAASNSTNYNKLINSDSSNGGSSGSNSNDNADTLISVTEGTTEEVFSNFANVSYNGKWGYKPSKYNSTNNNLFLPAPPQSGDILDVTTAANSTANTYTMSIGARVDSSKKLGSYSNTYNVILVGNAIPYTITYNDSVVSTMPVDVDSTTSGTTVTLSNNTPTRTGYTFLGWCTTTPTSNSNGIDTCPSPATQYSPGDSWTLDQTGGTNALNLYAMWQEKSFNAAFAAAGKTKLGGYYVMQDMTYTICNNVATGQSTMLYDNRDNELYAIAKLKDDNCWMLDNLRLDLGNSAVLNNTTSSNTNVDATSLNYLKNGGGTTSDKYPTAKINNVAWTSSSQNYYSIPMTISTYKDTIVTSYGEGSGKIGVYYNYCAASAGTYCWGNGTSYSGSPSSDPKSGTLYDIDGDICPKGWRLPTSSSSGEYKALYTAYSSNQVNFKTALSTPLSGSFNDGSAISQGSDGNFWSSTWNYTSNMYDLYVLSSSVSPSGNYYRDLGFSVRCLLTP